MSTQPVSTKYHFSDLSHDHREFQFIAETHKEYGTLGWRLKNMPAFDPLPGMAVAHDILEHRPKDDSTTGELMALGAMMFVRGEDYFVNSGKVNTRPSYHCSGELGDLLLKIHSGEWVPLLPTNHTLRGLPNDIQEEIKEGIYLTKKHLREDRGNEYSPSPEEWRRVKGWIAEGYRHATRRYKDVDRWDLLMTFQEIEEKADLLLERAKEGDVLKISLEWQSGIITDRRHPELKIHHIPAYELEEEYA